jgi:hypothetical protein
MDSAPSDYPLLSLTRRLPIYNASRYGGHDILEFYRQHLSEGNPVWRFSDINRRYNEVDNKYQKTGEGLEDVKKIEDEFEAFEKELKKEVNPEKLDGNAHFRYMKELGERKLQQERNTNARLAIVQALGGEEFCRTIPVIYWRDFKKDLREYPNFKVTDIPSGHSMAQYEDVAGRKGVLMKVRNTKTDEFSVFWFFQRYRETSLGTFTKTSEYDRTYNGLVLGDEWVGDTTARCPENLRGTDNIVNFIMRIKPQPHELYEFFG